jgi:hypothetical protein
MVVVLLILEERMLGVCLSDDLAIMLILVRDVR